MNKLLLVLFLIISINCVWAQTTTPEQQKAIQVEQQKLKEGKISYEEYQKRYDKITKPVAPASEVTSTNSVEPIAIKKDSVPIVAATNKDTVLVKKQESIQEQPKKEVVDFSSSSTPAPNQTNNSSGVIINKTPTNYSSQLRPGDELIKFTNNLYAGLVVSILSYVPLMVGSLIITATGGTAGIGVFLLGGAGVVAGTVYALASFRHVKKAGQLLNIQQQNPR